MSPQSEFELLQNIKICSQFVNNLPSNFPAQILLDFYRQFDVKHISKLCSLFAVNLLSGFANKLCSVFAVNLPSKSVIANYTLLYANCGLFADKNL